MRCHRIDSLAQGYLPDLPWYFYRWATNHRRMRERFPNLRKAISFQRRLHSTIWDE